MFNNHYFQIYEKRNKNILDYYTPSYFFGKKVLDLGCGFANSSGTLYLQGANITVVDARQEHLTVVNKKYSNGFKTIKADLDRSFPFTNQKFDVILDLGLLCHLSDFKKHLQQVCQITTDLILETAVADSLDPDYCLQVPEPKAYDLSFNGMGCRPSPTAIEQVLIDCGMTFKRITNSKYNAGEYIYDWIPRNNKQSSINQRAIWFVKNTNQINIPKAPNLIFTPPPIQDDMRFGRKRASPKPPQQQTQPINSIEEPMTEPKPTIINGSPSLNYNDQDKKFVIVIPSYNNSKWCDRNIESALDQNYVNYRIIFTDDCSNDGTFAKVQQKVSGNSKATLIRNSNRVGALANLYNMIHSCADDEIVLTLDGDDWFPHNNILNKMNQVYSNPDIWITFGQYQNSTDKGHGVSKAYPQHVIDRGIFRSFAWQASHLRTFYAWLFKKIRKEDLMHKGQFFQATYDMAVMHPMLEMAGTHQQFLSDILYIYNLENPLNDHKVSAMIQRSLDKQIRGMAQYQRVAKAPPPPPKQVLAMPVVAEAPVLITDNNNLKIGLLLIATGKYDRFVQPLITSADQFFIKNNPNITYYIFSDKDIPITTTRQVEKINIEHKPFPFASGDRFKHFVNNEEKLKNQDYLYYVDVDCLFVDKVDKEIIGDLVGVQHCGYVNRMGTFEDNPASCLYVDPKRYKFYAGGGFSGGKTENYLNMAKWCYNAFEQDVANGIMPRFADESCLNRYFLDHEPSIILDPSMHFPQSNHDHYKQIWGNKTYIPKLILLDKDHENLRN